MDIRARLLGMTLGLIVGACATKPPSMPEIAPEANLSEELRQTQERLHEAQTESVDVLSPQSFEKAHEALLKAQRFFAQKNHQRNEVAEQISLSRGWLAQARANQVTAKNVYKEFPAARTRAIRANAPRIFAREFTRLEEIARDITEDGEDGNFKGAALDDARLSEKYRELETKSLTRNFLGDTEALLKQARQQGATKRAPKTFRRTEEMIQTVKGLIERDSENLGSIARHALDATQQARFLLRVNAQVLEGNTETLVLESQEQKRRLAALSAQQNSAELALLKKETALEMADRLRQNFSAREADVTVEKNQVKIRLKAWPFEGERASLSAEGTRLLEKVQEGLKGTSLSRIVVEGPENSAAELRAKQRSSLKRAEMVQNFLSSTGVISHQHIQAVGREASKSTQNPNLDLVIEPELPSRVE